MDIFTRRIHGIRLKYAAVSVVCLAVAVVLFYMGGPRVFGWYDFFAVLTLIVMVVTLFLLQCHYMLGPIEKMSAAIDGQTDGIADAKDHARIPWSGKDEFACLAASMNSLLEVVQNRGIRLQEDNRRLKDILSSISAEIIAVNSSGTVLGVMHCPKEFEPVPGITRGCMPDSQVWGDDNIKAFMSAVKSACTGGETQSAELVFDIHGSRSKRRVKAVVKRANATSFPVVVFHDTGGAAAGPDPESRRVPLSRVAAGISRDLKNVFLTIRSLADRYADSEKPEVRETVAAIQEAIHSGAAVMENLLLLGGETRMNLRPVDAGALIEDMKKSVDKAVDGSGVRTEYGITGGGGCLLADLRQLRRVFEIVAVNSVEAFGTMPGRIRITAEDADMTTAEGAGFYPPQQPGKGILFRIEDDGPGMPEDMLSRAFEPYASTKSKSRGLGLAIAGSIVEAHGGGMRIRSDRDAGTKVDVFLRFSSRAADDIEMLLREFPGGEVLVVDDNKSVLKITSALLRTQKIAAHVADCRVDALRKFSELSRRLRAVLLDAQLGDETSVGLLQNMRDIDHDVPVIVVSGYTKNEIDSIFRDAVPDGFLMKPYTILELQSTLSRFSQGGVAIDRII